MAWGFERLGYLTKLCLRSGYGDLGMRSHIYGGKLLLPNMGRPVGDGVLELLEGRMNVVCGRTLGKGLRVSLVMRCMRQVRVFVSDSGMTLGVALPP